MAADDVSRQNAGTRRANRRLAIALALVALGFYLMMLFFLPQ